MYSFKEQIDELNDYLDHISFPQGKYVVRCDGNKNELTIDQQMLFDRVKLHVSWLPDMALRQC